MPESSDSSAPSAQPPQDPLAGKTPVPGADKSGTAAAAGSPLSLVPRNKSGGGTPPKEAGTTEGAATSPASFTDFMHWMKEFAATTETAPTETAQPTGRLGRSTLPKEQRKFQRYDREQTSAAEAAAAASVPTAAGAVLEGRSAPGEPEPEVEEEERAATPQGRPVPIALTGGTSGRRQKPGGRRQTYFWLWLQLGAVGLIVASFVVGRITVPKAAAPVKSAAPAAPGTSADGSASTALSPEAAKLIDQAMTAEQNRKFDDAANLLLEVQKDYPHVRDLDYHLATIAIEKNDVSKALPLLNTSIAEGEEAAAAYKLRGTILNRQGGVAARGMIDFETATKVDPFSADNFYFWGEALRRAGKSQAALIRLNQAMDRLREPELESQYRLKIRLTQIELGQEQEFAAEMAQKLAENPPPADWLLTAAAVALQHHNLTEAAGYLDKAALYFDQETFAMRLRDFFFFSFHNEKALARFFTFLKARPAGEAPAPSVPAGSPAPGSDAPPDITLPKAASLLQGVPQTPVPQTSLDSAH